MGGADDSAGDQVGYLSGAQSGKGLLLIDPVRGPLVRAAFREYGTGRYTKSEVLRRVTALGLTTVAGKPLTAQSFCTLLRNPIYAGWLSVPRWQVSARGDFEALVPESDFRHVQLLLEGKGVPLRRHVRDGEDFPLRRFVACSHCSTPLTGSWSKGRTKKYAYYHCRKCRHVKTAKRVLEGRFVELLSTLRPEPGYMHLFNAIIMDAWKNRQSETQQVRERLQSVVRQKRERLDRIDEAFLHERSIDRTTYERQRDQHREQVALAEMELNDAVLDQLDIDGVLAFAEHVVTNAARLWTELDLVQKQRLQQVLFPEGLRFDGEKFGTAVTCLAFKKLDEGGGANSGVASPRGMAASWIPVEGVSDYTASRVTSTSRRFGDGTCKYVEAETGRNHAAPCPVVAPADGVDARKWGTSAPLPLLTWPPGRTRLRVDEALVTEAAESFSLWVFRYVRSREDWPV